MKSIMAVFPRLNQLIACYFSEPSLAQVYGRGLVEVRLSPSDLCLANNPVVGDISWRVLCVLAQRKIKVCTVHFGTDLKSAVASFDINLKFISGESTLYPYKSKPTTHKAETWKPATNTRISKTLFGYSSAVVKTTFQPLQRCQSSLNHKFSAKRDFRRRRLGTWADVFV